jgi:hypothetical protein
MYRVLPKANTKFIRPFDLGVHTFIEKPAIVNYTTAFSDTHLSQQNRSQACNRLILPIL